jgi:FAD/FMN-containing dehydrogenase
MRSSPTTLSIQELRRVFTGRVIVPDDPEYDRARIVHNGAVDKRPAVIIRPVDADEVARVISLARETGLELAIRSGAHSGAGHGVCDGGIVLDLSDMRALDIDVEGRTAWAQTGLTAGDYAIAAGEHGLATGFGDTGSVGIGGITLGGGIGFLVRKQGLTIDSLLAAEVVTADGEILLVDEDSHPDLFWAIRGGGGNFGVATRFKFRLHELPSIVGGHLYLPATPDVITGFFEAAEAAPEELSTILNVMPAPPMPFLPEEQHGKLVAWGLLVYAGDKGAGERAVAPFRALAKPIADIVKPMPYAEMFEAPEEDQRIVATGRTNFVDGFDHSSAESILEHVQASDALMAVTHLRVLGGAMARVPDQATAFAHRRRRYMVAVAAIHERPEEGPEHEPWVEGLMAALGRGDMAPYVNFLGEEGEQRVRDGYPDSTWERLVAIKARYDPDNLFRLNQNIPPAIEGAER